MAFKTKLPLLFFLFSLILLSATLCLGYESSEDPQKEYHQCQRRCQQQERGQRQQCQQQCEQQRREREEKEEGRGNSHGRDPQKEYKQCQHRCEQQERGQRQQCQQQCEQQRREREEREEGRGNSHGRDPQKEYKQCQHRCEQQERGQRQQCQQQCEERRREQEREQEGRGGSGYTDWRRRSEEEQQQEQENNPYYYSDQHFRTRIRTSEGHVRLLQRFTEKSELLRGIDNYRVAILEANPNTFIIPNHQDADSLLYVVKGRGTISLMRQDNRETHNLERGDVMRIPAGAIVYLINRDNNEKLFIAKLLRPISVPGHVEAFFGPGGEDPESFYSSFSHEVLEAAFNTPMEKLQRLIGQQKRGAIIKASQEQIKALSPHGRWPFGSESNAPYNLLHHRPMHSNRYGQLYQVNPNHYKQLEDMDMAISFANISSGGMAGPYYNSRATKISVVLEGKGYFEMACPHLSSSSSAGGHQGGRGGSEQHHEQRSGRYQKVSARLSPGDVIVAPAGHPIVLVASRNQNLQIVCFEVNAHDNEKNLLAGRDSMLNQIEKEAKELAFNLPAREVEEIFNNQKETFFFPGPSHRQEQGRAFE
ncbi:Cupin 1 [Macleaya cordata]|uniref:Cupin 1 n=1 Tax=Macleaya cordata TaxID=56857 RepID=A0A200Q4N7_MACCD|nr:Cupin 1 [Macleaya cordata]